MIYHNPLIRPEILGQRINTASNFIGIVPAISIHQNIPQQFIGDLYGMGVSFISAVNYYRFTCG
ncbi:MAG: hypothetical protein ACJAZB_000666 [Psychrosphaera sp.]|jgi:hypothetical protein